MAIPDPNQVAAAVLLFTSAIVLVDAYKLLKVQREVPTLGHLVNGGFAWESEVGHEVIRNLTQLLALTVMMVTPWFLAERSGTPLGWLVVFDGLLAIHCITLLLPKRYALTRDRLWADGIRYDWNNLAWKGWKGGSRVVLFRKGWWLFAPLPLGGSPEDLIQIAARIDAIDEGCWDDFVAGLDSEE